jgi:putative ABC transport system permease protein
MGGAPIARLKDGVTVEAASAEVTSLLPQLRANQPPTPIPGGPPPPAPARYEVVGLQDLLVAPVKPALIMLTWAVGFVLLIAAINVANLLLARTAARRREVAVRLSVGASRGRLVRQALTESVVLEVIGGAAGVGLAYGGIRLLQVLAAGLPRADVGQGVGLPRLDEITIDRSVLLFTLGASVVTGMVFGLAPALRQGRWRPMEVLREASGSVMSGFTLSGRNRLQGLLVVAEIAMATILLVGGGLLIAVSSICRTSIPATTRRAC